MFDIPNPETLLAGVFCSLKNDFQASSRNTFVVTQSKRRAKTLEISTLRKFRMQIQRVFKQNAPVAAVRRSGNSREFDVMFALAARGHILYISCKQASTQQQHLGSNCVYTL